MKTFNREITKIKRRKLRKNQTEAERKLWNKLRKKQIGGHKFFRQFGIGSYIVDFYCPLLKIVIEVDGGQHYDQEAMIYDNRRKGFLGEAGIKVIRFNNLDVLRNIEGVYEAIQKELPIKNL
jgi:very-short-patch-repair endonuclease